MEIIRIECVISSYFEINENRQRISFFTLDKYRKEIENRFRKKDIHVVVDLSNSSLVNATLIYPNLFYLSESLIGLCDKKDKLDLKCLSSLVSPSIKEEYQNIFREINNELANQVNII